MACHLSHIVRTFFTTMWDILCPFMPYPGPRTRWSSNVNWAARSAAFHPGLPWTAPRGSKFETARDHKGATNMGPVWIAAKDLPNPKIFHDLPNLSHTHFSIVRNKCWTQLMHAPNWGSKDTWSTLVGNFCFPCETGLHILSNVIQFELLKRGLVGGSAMMMVVRLFCWPPKASWMLCWSRFRSQIQSSLSWVLSNTSNKSNYKQQVALPILGTLQNSANISGLSAIWSLQL